MTPDRTPTALIILDGFGLREAAPDNAISNANTPVWDKLTADYPQVPLATSGAAVGLPDGQMGNSEVGHMNLGAGRIIYQNYTRINQAIKTGQFRENTAIKSAIEGIVRSGKTLHLLGLLSPGGVHSHEQHLMELCKMAADLGVTSLSVHAILDGRDTPPKSAAASLTQLRQVLDALGIGQISSVVGRYYAMDRDNRWDRVQAAYQLYTEAQGAFQANSALEGLEMAYERGESDEFVQATLTGDAAVAKVQEGDALIFANFRPDRAREITRAFIGHDFDGFERNVNPKLSQFVMMTEYADDIKTACAFPPESIENTLGEWVAQHGKTQLRIAETEKYAHVTFFFNGGVETPFEGETRILVDSPKVATYDLQPEMSAFEVTDKLVEAIQARQFDLIVCNYANGDMVGHTGNFDASVKAVEVLDQCLGKILAALDSVQGHALITADHGNCEQMQNPDSGQPLTSHTTGPVPLAYFGSLTNLQLKTDGALCDIAPTLLDLMQLPKPAEMAGNSLIQSAE